jgi:hypothetical protein
MSRSVGRLLASLCMWAEQAPTSVADSPQGMPLPWPLQLPWALVRPMATLWVVLACCAPPPWVVGVILCLFVMPALVCARVLLSCRV